MTFLVQHIRSGEYAKRPGPLDLAPGQLAVNYNEETPGLFFRTDAGSLIKAGPTYVGISAPPQINYTERSIGEMWLDTTDSFSPSLKVYTDGGWKVVNVLDGSITSDKIADGAVSASKISLNNSLIPTEDGLFSLGSSVNKMAAVYADAISSDTLTISTSLMPAVNLGASLGSPTMRFANIYTGDLHLKNERGDWTLIEEEDFLRIKNNKTGKSFKITMEALD